MNKLKKGGKISDVALKPLIDDGVKEVSAAKEAIMSADLMTKAKVAKPKAKSISSKAARTA